MSFLIDPPWLYVIGHTYGRVLPEEGRAAEALEAATAGAFLLTSVSLYLDLPWTRPIWRACRAASGRDWMLNSGVFRFDSRKMGARTHLASAAIFATYPFWLRLGVKQGRASGDRQKPWENTLKPSRGHQDRCTRVPSDPGVYNAP